MMWLDGDILQVYWAGIHYVAAYLGNSLVWRENIRAFKGSQNISMGISKAESSDSLGVAGNKRLDESIKLEALSSSSSSKSITSSISHSFKSNGEAYIRPAWLPVAMNSLSIHTLGSFANSSEAIESLGVPLSESLEISGISAACFSILGISKLLETIKYDGTRALSKPSTKCKSLSSVDTSTSSGSEGAITTPVLGESRGFTKLGAVGDTDIIKVSSVASILGELVTMVASASLRYPRFTQSGEAVYVYRPKRWKQEGDTVYIDYEEASWIDPVEDGDALIIQQVYSATESDDYLEVE